MFCTAQVLYSMYSTLTSFISVQYLWLLKLPAQKVGNLGKVGGGGDWGSEGKVVDGRNFEKAVHFQNL